MTGSTYEHPAAQNPPPRRRLDDARAAATLARAKPAYAAGIRAGIATVVPLIVDHILHTGGGSWMSLAGLNGGLIDRGGPYRTRGIVLGALAALSATFVFVGTLAGNYPVLAICTTFVVALLCGLMRVWPDVGPGFGVTTLITYVIALALPIPDIRAAAIRAGFIALGGLWAMVIAIIVWPLRPYRPVRLAVAACYRSVAEYLEHVVARPAAVPPADPWAFKADLVTVRDALETARRTLASMRRSRSTESRRGERLLILHELADQIYVHVIALAAIVEGARAASISPTARDALASAGDRAATLLRTIADGIESERDEPRAQVEWSGKPLRAAAAPDESPSAASNRAQLAELLDRIAEYADGAAAFTATLSSGAPVPDLDDRFDVAERPERAAALLSVTALMRPDSAILQHALRVAVVTTIAVVVTALLRLNHGYWVTLTAVVILQPYAGATRQKALQRVAGTIVGGIIAAIASLFFAGTPVVTVLVFVFTALCVALLPVNYGAYTIFGTPAFVLLAEASAKGAHLAELRVVNTLIGGALALVGSRFLWPVDEWNRLPEFSAAAIRATAEFLRRAGAIARTGDVRGFGSLRDVRRKIALAAANAEDSFQRLLGEDTGPTEDLEPIMACLVYTRRVAAAIATFALATSVGAPPIGAELDAFVDAGASMLDDLAEAITSGRTPEAWPSRLDIPSGGGAPSTLGETRVRRLARQLKLLHDAADRWVTSGVGRQRR